MAGKTIKITQVKSPISRPADQRATLVSLKLNKIGRSQVWDTTPETLGRIDKVKHLLRVESAES